MSVIGITQSGKTVYLSSFLRDLEVELARAGLTLVSAGKPVHDFVASYPIEQDKQLPMGTVAKKPSEPLIFNLRASENKNHTVVLFDIAGENCVDPQQMQIYGKFIKKSSGIIMLIDPHQFTEIGGKLSRESDQEDIDRLMLEQSMHEQHGQGRITPTMVLQTIHDAFFAGRNEKIDIPIALTVGKFDQMMNISGVSDFADTLCKNIEVSSNISTKVRTAYYVNKFRTDTINKHNILRRIIGRDRDGDALLISLESLYSSFVLFAASALGEGAHRSIKESDSGELVTVLDTRPIPFGIYNPFFWILFNKIRISSEIKEEHNSEHHKGWFGRRRH